MTYDRDKDPCKNCVREWCDGQILICSDCINGNGTNNHYERKSKKAIKLYEKFAENLKKRNN